MVKMLLFLLTVSMILHLITFLILALLMKKMKNTLNYEQLEKQRQEIEDVLAFYSLEMKEDNERFLEQIQKQQEENNESEHESITRETNEQENVTEEIATPEPLSEETEAYEPSLEAKALRLYREGNDVKEIAKKLSKGHGEIELLLKFHR